MIIIGSHAARLGGFYPAWRDVEGFKGSQDIDVITREAEHAYVTSCFERSFPVTSGYSIGEQGGLHFEISSVPDAIYLLLKKLCYPDAPLNLGGIDMLCRVATPEVIWMTLYYTVGASARWYVKNFKDLLFYDRLVHQRGLLTDDHRALGELWRDMTVRRILASIERGGAGGTEMSHCPLCKRKD